MIRVDFGLNPSSVIAAGFFDMIDCILKKAAAHKALIRGNLRPLAAAQQ